MLKVMLHYSLTNRLTNINKPQQHQYQVIKPIYSMKYSIKPINNKRPFWLLNQEWRVRGRGPIATFMFKNIKAFDRWSLPLTGLYTVISYILNNDKLIKQLNCEWDTRHVYPIGIIGELCQKGSSIISVGYSFLLPSHKRKPRDIDCQ